jgi:hypothetical protein
MLVAAITSALLPYVLPSSKREDTIQQLKLHYNGKLVDEIAAQILDNQLIRENLLWTLKISSSFRDSRESSRQLDFVSVDVRNDYILSSNSASENRACVIYHLPNTLLEGSAIVDVKIYSLSRRVAIVELKGPAIKSYLEEGAYGVFLKIPVTLKPFESVKVELHAVERHRRESEMLLVSYIPALDFKVRIEILEELSQTITVRSEYYHPSRAYERNPSNYGSLDGNQGIFFEHLIDKPCLPYEGIRICWNT